MKKMIFFLLLFCACTCVGQSIDSLKQAIETMPEDTNRVLAYRALFFSYYDQDQRPQMLETADKGLTLSRALRFDKGVDLFLFYKATALDIAGRGQEAIPLFEEGLLLAQKKGDQSVAASYELNIGTAYYTLGNLDKALDHFLNAYALYKSLNKPQNLSKVLNNIGIIYRTQGKKDRAEAIYKESLAIKQTLGDSLGIAASCQNLAAVLSTVEREEEALNYLQQALAIYEKNKRLRDAAGCYALLGQIYFNFGKIPEAKEALLKAKSVFDQAPSAEYVSNIYRLLGTISVSEKNYSLAETYFLKSAEGARQYGQLDRLWDILNELSKTQNQLGKHPAAYSSLREAFTLRDSIVEKNRLALMEELQTKFDVAQKDNQLTIQQLSLERRTSERNSLFIAAGLLILLAFGIFWGLKHRIRTNKKIAEQESTLQKQQIRQLEQEKNLAALNAMVEGAEKERARIAADLHDGLGGLLASVKAHFNQLHQSSDTSELQSKTNRLIDDAAGEVRRISHDMMPRSLSVAGLSGALEDLVADLEKQGIHCTLEMIGMGKPLEERTALMVYRIIQELCNNMVKHAQANQALIQLIQAGQTLTLIVEDNGKGFDPVSIQGRPGLGLNNIESRVQFLKGRIDWDTAPGRGTNVTISIPVF
ncbi:MAG: sensor histidine kinase [Saprospiraceae bacterium]|nr:sensor histidine kinase [Saprospiraceae bacterium]